MNRENKFVEQASFETSDNDSIHEEQSVNQIESLFKNKGPKISKNEQSSD